MTRLVSNSRKGCERTFAAIAFVIAGLFAVSPSEVHAQSLNVKGELSSASGPVRNALVTFADNGNSSLNYTAVTDSNGDFEISGITAVRSSGQTPMSFKLEQNYPNPFSSKTAISYQLNKQSDVHMTIYDVLGRVVRNYRLGIQEAGVHGIIWNGRNNFGGRVAPGVYFYRLKVRGRTEVKKLVYGIGASQAAVSLSGLLPSANAEVGVGADLPLRSENFTVSIVNTDSTSPVIIPTQVSDVNVGSDTSMNFTASVDTAGPVVVYGDSTNQLIEGFGAANTVNWDVGNLTNAEVTEAYDTLDGDLGFTIMRLRIAPDSSQFSASIPSAKLAASYGAKIIASPWTPPYWMKTNDSLAGGYVIHKDYAAYAGHLAAFADTMQAGGVPIYAISVQNEPDAHVNYESCFWTPADIDTFMHSYAPMVGVPVFMPESESYDTSYSNPTLRDSVACAHTAFVGGHLYGASPFVYSLALKKGKQVWMTEIFNGNSNWSGNLSTGLQMDSCMYDNMSAYVYWWTLASYGPMGYNGLPSKRGYVMSQFARFVRPGYYRITADENPQPNVYLTAYKGNGKTVIVVVNTGSSAAGVRFNLKNASAASFTPYVTSSTENCVQKTSVPVSNGTFTANVEASSVTTFVFQ